MIKKIMFEKKDIISYAVFIAVIFSVVYISFAVNGYMYMYVDIGADTYASYWPSFAYVKYWLTHMSAWDMSLGLGSSVITQLCYFLIDPFNIIILCFDSYNMYIGIFISLMLKYIVLSLISYKYIRILHISENWIINNIAATSIVFSGWFVSWGQHYYFATIYVIFIFVMYFFEKWLQQKFWLGFVFAITYLCMMSPYYGYTILLFLAFYYILRYLAINRKFQASKFFKHAFQTAGFCLLGVGSSFILFLPAVEEILGSPRVSGGFSLSIHLASVKEYQSAILRFLSNNIQGINVDFNGYANYYEAPFFYTGLLLLIVLPNLFLRKNRKKIYIVCSIICAVALVFIQNTALIFNMLSAIIYRWTFVFIPVFAMALGIALDLFWKTPDKTRVSKFTVFFWITFELGYLAYLYINHTDMSEVIFYTIIVNIVLLMLYQITLYDFKKIGLFSVYLVMVIDLTWNAFVSVDCRSLIPASSRENMEYFDETEKIVQDLTTSDNNFYRLYKKYAYIDLNDTMFQHYAGERFYSSTLSDSYWNLLDLFDLRTKSSNYFYGFDDKQVLRDINCGKYMITKEQRTYYGYKMLKKSGEKYLYLNENSHNFGFVYNSIISMEDYASLPGYEQQDVLYEAGIIENEDINNMQDVPFVKNSTCSELYPVTYTMELMADAIELTLGNPNNKPLLLEIAAPAELPGIINGYLYSAEVGKEYSPYDYINISLGAGEKKYYMINALDLEKVKITISPNQVMSLALYEKEMGEIEKQVIHNNANSLNIAKQGNDYVCGSIYTENSAVLFLPIIYDHNWHAYVDGIEKEVLRVNGGFSGVKLDPGSHEILFKYEAKAYLYGAMISLICIFIVLILWGLQKKRVQKEKSNQEEGKNGKK